MRLRRRVDGLVEGDPSWIRYADARVELEIAVQEQAFNIGVEVGAVLSREEQARRARPRARAETPDERELRVACRQLLLMTNAPAPTRLAVLLDLAASLVVEVPNAATLSARLAPVSHPMRAGHRNLKYRKTREPP